MYPMSGVGCKFGCGRNSAEFVLCSRKLTHRKKKTHVLGKEERCNVSWDSFQIGYSQGYLNLWLPDVRIQHRNGSGSTHDQTLFFYNQPQFVHSCCHHVGLLTVLQLLNLSCRIPCLGKCSSVHYAPALWPILPFDPICSTLAILLCISPILP